MPPAFCGIPNSPAPQEPSAAVDSLAISPANTVAKIGGTSPRPTPAGNIQAPSLLSQSPSLQAPLSHFTQKEAVKQQQHAQQSSPIAVAESLVSAATQGFINVFNGGSSPNQETLKEYASLFPKNPPSTALVPSFASEQHSPSASAAGQLDLNSLDKRAQVFSNFGAYRLYKGFSGKIAALNEAAWYPPEMLSGVSAQEEGFFFMEPSFPPDDAFEYQETFV